MYKLIKYCRICGSIKLKKIINLNDQPPANSLHKKNVSIKNVPLELLYCLKCHTAQLSATVNPKYLFNNYLWLTSTSTTAKKYSDFFFNKINQKIKERSFIVEIASNDGTFLRPFKKSGHKILGVDPAKNIVNIAKKQKINTICNFFNYKTSKKILKNNGHADIVIARNVIPHVKDIHSIIKGISSLLSEKGIAVIEFHYAKIIIDELHYDSIYHEHLFYFTIETITNIFGKYLLKPFDIFRSPISGGSLVLFFSKENKKESVLLKKIKKDEKRFDLNSFSKWRVFAKKTYLHSKELKKTLDHYLLKDQKLVGFGASARSSTLLNFNNINSSKILYIMDKNSLKHNLYTPGSNILVCPYRRINKHYNVILLAWNFKDEFIKYLKSTNYKGKIIIPLPNKVFIYEV
jgi:hypothetical protein